MPGPPYGRFLSSALTKQGEQIHLFIISIAVIGIAVHVNGYTGNQHQIPVYTDQFFRKLVSVFQDYPARYRQGPVKPGGAEHTSVTFCVQLYIFMFHFQQCVFFDFKSGRITVGGGNMKPVVRQILTGMEGNDAGIVTGDVIFPLRPDVPGLTFTKLQKAICLKYVFHGFDGMECCWAFF